MIHNVLKKYKYVKQYKEDCISDDLVKDLLNKTWKTTPSKNNFMPYKVHVLGPEHQEYKEKTFLKCLKNEAKADSIENIKEMRYSNHLPNYGNILSCSHLLIFTLRVEHDPNPYQKDMIRRGHKFPATQEDNIHDEWANASLEIGMFANTFKALCLEQNIDVAFVGCYQTEVEYWHDVPFIKRCPLLIMTIGKGNIFRQDRLSEIEKQDLKPSFEKVVNFVK